MRGLLEFLLVGSLIQKGFPTVGPPVAVSGGADVAADVEFLYRGACTARVNLVVGRRFPAAPFEAVLG
jgi:hypothetical protein